MNLKEHLKALVDALIQDKDCSIESMSVSLPTTEDATASIQDDHVKQVPTGEMFISIMVKQKPK